MRGEAMKVHVNDDVTMTQYLVARRTATADVAVQFARFRIGFLFLRLRLGDIHLRNTPDKLCLCNRVLLFLRFLVRIVT